MREGRHNSVKYENYLRPILQRLKQIDGRAPVSIMTNRVAPDDDLLAPWLDEGLTIDVHTVDHPCPLLQFLPDGPQDPPHLQCGSAFHRSVIALTCVRTL